MTRYRATAQGKIPFTADEEAEWDAMEAAQKAQVQARELPEFLAYVDAQVDAIYIAVQGERITEYMLAESEATAYKTAGYKGTVPGSVASWAAAKGKDARWACDDILTTAASWRYMQNMLRSQRLGIKEQAKTAPNLAPLRTQFDGFVVGVKQKLGIA